LDLAENATELVEAACQCGELDCAALELVLPQADGLLAPLDSSAQQLDSAQLAPALFDLGLPIPERRFAAIELRGANRQLRLP